MRLPRLGTTRRQGQQVAGAPAGRARSRFGVLLLTAAVLTSVLWLYWRTIHLGWHPVEVIFFAAEVASLVSGLLVGIGIARAEQPRTVFENHPRESFRYAFAVADLVGRTRSSDVRVDLVAAYRRLRSSDAGLPDLAIAAVLTDGPRRLATVAAVTYGLLLGVAPMPMPPTWALALGLGSLALMSSAHVVLGGGRIRIGDRVRWSSAALGEVCSGADREGLAPRRWVGTVAVVVVVDLAVALRGMSDRWTHGLTPMGADERQLTMLIAIGIVIGSLFTLRTTAAPQLANSHLVSRHIEERTARQSALGGAVLIGTIGLLAGILPGSVDAAHDDPARIEVISDRDPPAVERIDAIEPIGSVEGVFGD